MQVEINIDNSCKETKVIVVTDKRTDAINTLVKKLAEDTTQFLVGFQGDIIVWSSKPPNNRKIQMSRSRGISALEKSMKAAVPLCGKGKSVPQSDTLFRKKEKKKRRKDDRQVRDKNNAVFGPRSGEWSQRIYIDRGNVRDCGQLQQQIRG